MSDTTNTAPVVVILREDAATLLTICDLYAPHQPNGELPDDIRPVAERVSESLLAAKDTDPR